MPTDPVGITSHPRRAIYNCPERIRKDGSLKGMGRGIIVSDQIKNQFAHTQRAVSAYSDARNEYARLKGTALADAYDLSLAVKNNPGALGAEDVALLMAMADTAVYAALGKILCSTVSLIANEHKGFVPDSWIEKYMRSAENILSKSEWKELRNNASVHFNTQTYSHEIISIYAKKAPKRVTIDMFDRVVNLALYSAHHEYPNPEKIKETQFDALAAVIDSHPEWVDEKLEKTLNNICKDVFKCADGKPLSSEVGINTQAHAWWGLHSLEKYRQASAKSARETLVSAAEKPALTSAPV